MPEDHQSCPSHSDRSMNACPKLRPISCRGTTNVDLMGDTRGDRQQTGCQSSRSTSQIPRESSYSQKHDNRIENAEANVLIAVYLFICMRVIRISKKVLNRIA